MLRRLAAIGTRRGLSLQVRPRDIRRAITPLPGHNQNVQPRQVLLRDLPDTPGNDSRDRHVLKPLRYLLALTFGANHLPRTINGMVGRDIAKVKSVGLAEMLAERALESWDGNTHGAQACEVAGEFCP